MIARCRAAGYFVDLQAFLIIRSKLLGIYPKRLLSELIQTHATLKSFSTGIKRINSVLQIHKTN
jgi:hypothetical protein